MAGHTTPLPTLPGMEGRRTGDPPPPPVVTCGAYSGATTTTTSSTQAHATTPADLFGIPRLPSYLPKITPATPAWLGLPFLYWFLPTDSVCCRWILRILHCYAAKTPSSSLPVLPPPPATCRLCLQPTHPCFKKHHPPFPFYPMGACYGAATVDCIFIPGAHP